MDAKVMKIERNAKKNISFSFISEIHAMKR